MDYTNIEERMKKTISVYGGGVQSICRFNFRQYGFCYKWR